MSSLCITKQNGGRCVWGVRGETQLVIDRAVDQRIEKVVATVSGGVMSEQATQTAKRRNRRKKKNAVGKAEVSELGSTDSGGGEGGGSMPKVRESVCVCVCGEI